MYRARPSFRPWRCIFALVLAYFLARPLYFVPSEAAALYEDPVHALQFGIGLWWLVLLFHLAAGLTTVWELGFPHIDDGQKNLRPIIVPLALVLLVFATHTVRFGRKPPVTGADSSTVVIGADPAHPERDR